MDNPLAITAARYRTKDRLQRDFQLILLHLLATFLVILFMGPFVWTVSSSLKTSLEIDAFPPMLFPAQPRFENYLDVFQEIP
ncbi:MAG TPA: hypothetical protein VKX46_17510, partial [Ktedonobacteraceae bacterium]|nr:hypothetical protein [Ktedonobacteraceae bacterium]